MKIPLPALCISAMLCLYTSLNAQCPEQAPVYPTPQPGTCGAAESSLSIAPYFDVCQTICLDNTGVGASGQVGDLSCMGGSDANDLWIHAENLYNAVPGYDGSIGLRWVNWPNKATGALPPYVAIHAEVDANLAGTAINVIGINCGDGFIIENAICLPPEQPGQQFYAVAGTFPTLAELDPVVDAQGGIDLDLNDINYWIQFVSSDGGQGEICFEVSTYEAGSLCGDAISLPLSGSAGIMTGSTSGCLCDATVYGGLASTVNNLPVPCGMESASALWYEINATYDCNIISADVSVWGGSDDYNVAILSGVNCPGDNGTNPITGAAVFTPGQTLELGTVVESSACGTAAVTAQSLPAGIYYIYVSGASERPTFTLDVTVEDGATGAGMASSGQNGTNVCSGTTMQVSTSGAVLPLSANGQSVAWFYDENINFNPYNNEGTYAGSGTNNVDLNLPTNTGCDEITIYIKGIVSDDGTSAVANCTAVSNVLNVTVYPEIGTSSVLNQQCLITVAGRCPDFTVNGNAGSDTYTGTAAEDGNTISFIISNGLTDCNETAFETLTCGSTSCAQPSGSAMSICDTNDPFNFYIEVSFTAGSASSYLVTASDGSAIPSNGGTVQLGPFANDNTISVSIDNTEDPSCNLPLGNFTNNCNPLSCPNLTSTTASTSGDVCSGDLVILQATVDQGILGTDYAIQWLVNDEPIPGATVLTYNYDFSTSQNCAPEVQSFSAEITCLTANAAPATNPTMDVSGFVTVYPIPQLGIDFIPDPSGCSVTPIDNCGGLVITNSPVSDPMPGDAAVTVNYTVSLTGAPAGCAATGTYTIECEACGSDAGAGVNATDNVYCDGETFSLATDGATLENGYTIGYAVSTTNPFNNLESTVIDAVNTGNVIGPYTAADVVSLTNGTDYGPGTFYFTPFTSLNLDNSQVLFSQSGSLESSTIFDVESVNITIPEQIYCAGVTEFNITFTATQTSGGGDPIDEISGLFSNGGGSGFNETLSNYSNNPSGQSVYLEISSSFGATVAYSLTVSYAGDYSFPTLCLSCDDVGNSVVVELLPEIILGTPTQPQVCAGEQLDLTSLNPSSNLVGTFNWYDADPNSGGMLITNPSAITPTNGDEYWVLFEADADPTCTASTSLVINTTALPSLNAIPNQPALCLGDVVDLTQLENSISSDPGIFTWYRGNPQTDPFAVQLTSAAAMNQSPAAGTTYVAVFAGTSGCSNQVSTTYTVNNPPQLTPILSQSLCSGAIFDLTSVESNLAGGLIGTFTWYDSNPGTGGTQISDPTNAMPNDGDEYFAVFEDANTNCTNSIGVSFTNLPAPMLNQPATPAALCVGAEVDLTTYEPGIILSPGTFTWYLDGQEVVEPDEVIPTDGQTYVVEFEDALTGCSATTSLTFTVLDNPILNTVSPNPFCGMEMIDLTAYNANVTTDAGTFDWYLGNPQAGGTVINDPTNVIPQNLDDYCALFTAANGCTGIACFTATVFAEVSGVTASFTCNAGLGTLAVDYTSAAGGNGTYQIASNSPNTDGEVLADGTAWTIIIEDSNGCAQAEVLTGTIACPVGLEDVLAQNSLSIYPNPTSNQFQVEFDLLATNMVQLTVQNILGQAVYQTEQTLLNGAYQHSIDMSDLASGVYLLSISVGEERLVKKVVRK